MKESELNIGLKSRNEELKNQLNTLYKTNMAHVKINEDIIADLDKLIKRDELV